MSAQYAHHRFVPFLIFLVSLLSQNAFTANDCGLTLNTTSVTIAWSPSFSSQAVGLTLSKSEQKACHYVIAFTKGSAPDYSSRTMTSGGNTLRYQLFGDVGQSLILKDLIDATSSNEVLSGQLPAGDHTSISLTYYVQIPQDPLNMPSYKPAGVYLDSYAIKLWDKPFGSAQQHAPVVSANVTLTTTISKMLDLSIVNTGSSFDPAQTAKSLDFGALTTGKTRGLDLLVRGNAGFAITFSSENNGALKHLNPGVSEMISYRTKINGTEYGLSSSQSSPVTVISGNGQTSAAGIQHSVLFEILSTLDRMAGTYRDNITVTATTTD
jgi:spore coat protein U-like protein